jgi:predicted hydrocarbon binding protein
MSKRIENWVCTLMSGLDEQVDKEKLVKVLEQCGRQCQSQSLIKKARRIYEQSDDVNDFLDKFGKIYKHLHRKGESIYIVYPKCYCSIVKNIAPGRLPATYCNCSRGWAKALFEGALKRPVEVTMEKSIKQGDDECRFKISL